MFLLMFFSAGHFINPVLVPAAFKGRIHKQFDHLLRQCQCHEAGRDANDIGIVVLAYQLRHPGI